METVANLIAARHGTKAAEAFREFKPNPAELDFLGQAGRYVLSTVPPIPGACVMMSAFWAKSHALKRTLPIYVVAGSLHLDHDVIFAAKAKIDWATTFSQSNTSWDGHCWVVFGTHICDISLLRTARSPYCPATLASHVNRVFGPRSALFMMDETMVAKSGFRYTPLHVLSSDQVDNLAFSAIDRWEINRKRT